MVPHHCHPSQLSLPGRARLPGLPRVAHLGGSPLANLLAELEVKIQLLRCAAVPPVASAAAAPPLLSNTRPGVVRLSTSHTHTQAHSKPGAMVGVFHQQIGEGTTKVTPQIPSLHTSLNFV